MGNWQEKIHTSHMDPISFGNKNTLSLAEKRNLLKWSNSSPNELCPQLEVTYP